MTTSIKTCFKCNQEKPRSEFYKHPQMGDGLLGKCKECTKKDVKERYEKDFKKIQEYEKSRANLPHRVALRRTYQKTDRGKEAMRRGRIKYASSEHGKIAISIARKLYDRSPKKYELIKEYRRKYPDRYNAMAKVMIAINNGTLNKNPCEICGEKKVHAHHEDYSKPLDVIWLCCSCHMKRHRQLRHLAVDHKLIEIR